MSFYILKQYVVVNSIKRIPEINKNTYNILFFVKKALDKVGHFNQCQYSWIKLSDGLI